MMTNDIKRQILQGNAALKTFIVMAVVEEGAKVLSHR